MEDRTQDRREETSAMKYIRLIKDLNDELVEGTVFTDNGTDTFIGENPITGRAVHVRREQLRDPIYQEFFEEYEG